MQVSFIEIYNETIRDLLRDSVQDNEDHEIRHTKTGTEVTNVTLIPVDPNNQDQIEEIMRMAARHRSVGYTDMNSQSSRSHSVFTLHLSAENATHKSRSVLKGTAFCIRICKRVKTDGRLALLRVFFFFFLSHFP